MCGIAGFFRLDGGAPPPASVLDAMVRAIRRRGPDDQGLFTDGPCGVGMRRLSIVDLSGGHQPIQNEDGTLTLVCNGEIYNHKTLRAELEAKGHRFKTHSDVEVILHLYEEHGPDAAKRLRGMFGFALWDAPKRRMVLGRDRLGIKPLYVAEADGVLYFGSELKALLAAGLRRELDPEALRDYFAYGYVPAPRSIFRGMRKLLPGHVLVAEKGRVSESSYWRYEVRPDPSLSEGEWLERLLALLRGTIKDHLMSDVPLGAFLSGGVDSSLIVALMSEFTDGPVNTFTMGFGGGKGGFLDERGYARQVADRYGARHTEFEVQPKLEEILDDVVDAFDEPFADDSVIPSYHICRLAAQKVKVALTGLGGDEMFAGYERYLGLRWSGLYGALPGFLRRAVGAVVGAVPELKSGHYTVNHLKRFVRSGDLPPAERYRDYVSIFNAGARKSLFAAEPSPEGPFEPFSSIQAPTLVDRALAQDIAGYLPEDILALSDRLSMWHGIELRVPFVDHEVVEFCARIPAGLKIRGEKKYLLKKLSRRFLPAEVIDHRKQGFAAPMAAWLRNDLKGVVGDALSPARLARHGLFRAEAVRGLWDAHQSRAELNDRKLFSIFMFQKWFERYMA